MWDNKPNSKPDAESSAAKYALTERHIFRRSSCLMRVRSRFLQTLETGILKSFAYKSDLNQY